MKRPALLVATAALACAPSTQQNTSASPAPGMTFFVTSTGSGNGANLGGLSGADKHCQDLAQAAGAGNHTWHAYLSTTGPGGVNARDRIGNGPWRNANGVVIAQSVADLHSANNNLNKQTALTETGATVSGRGDPVNTHDILTGSSSDGRAITGTDDTTCSNWTSSTTGAAMLGHHDRMGLRDDEPSKSWNSSHPSRGCSQENLRGTGGAGLTYCFAVN
ncbi:MAG TPA: hypothetical protein VF042_15745 [Gemmatimonadaceae bacterium]